MEWISTRKRRGGTTGDSEAGPGLSSTVLAALPPRYEALGEALASGSGSTVAAELVGAALARDGLSLAEALDSLATTTALVGGLDPDYTVTRALAIAWSEATLGYVHRLTCEDPLTGLATLAHLRAQITGAYRAQHSGEPVTESHALVVIAGPPWPGSPLDGEPLSEAMRAAQLGVTARTVFDGPETIGQVAPGRLIILTGRDDRIGRRVGLLRRMLDGSVDPQTRVWVEGLPETDEGASALLDELARV